MAPLPLTSVSADDLLAALMDQYFYIQDLIEKHDAQKREDNEQTLGRANAFIRRKVPVADWETEWSNNFLLMLCRLGRAEVVRLSQSDEQREEGVTEISTMADLVCSIVAVTAERLEVRVPQQAYALWTMTRLADGAASDGVEEFSRAAIDALGTFGVQLVDLPDQVRAQCVLYIGRSLNNGSSADMASEVEIARQWCADLLGRPGLGALLGRAAEVLGVSRAELPAGEEGPGPSEEPRFFQMPQRFTDSTLREEFKKCLFEVQGLTYEETCPLAPQTANRVKALRPDADASAFGQPFYFAALNLWKAYWSRGDGDALVLATRLAQLLCSVESGSARPAQVGDHAEVAPGGGADENMVIGWIVDLLQETGPCPYTKLGSELRRRHGDVARTWFAQVPLSETLRRAAATGRVALDSQASQQFAFLPTQGSPATSNGLSNGAAARATAPASPPGRDGRTWHINAVHIWMDVQLPQLIQTCSIPIILEDADRLCSALGCDMQGPRIREALVESFAGECKRLALADSPNERESLLRDNESALRSIHQEFTAGGVPQVNRDDELEAWEYLFPDDPGPGGDPGEPTTTTITADPAYQNVMMGGDPDVLKDFIAERVERIKELLLGRIQARLSPERVLRPEGDVRIRSAGGTQTAPLFLEARQDLDSSAWKDAAKKLERLERDVRNQAILFCQNYRAYALAKDGDLVGARQLLRPLVEARFNQSSAYWNLACCTTGQQSEQDRLDVLAKGLDAAPHPWLLSGAVALGLLLEDDQMPEWLLGWMPSLTLSEALLLSFYYEFDKLTGHERDKAFVLLREYANRGEPAQLDPTSRDKTINFYVMRDYLQALRLQPRAADFWLRAREPVGYNMFAYWQLRSQFLDDQRQTKEAAEKFEEELRCRLYALERNWTVGNLPSNVRQRAQAWLQRCLRSPELDPIGQRIYNKLVDFRGSQREGILRQTTEPTPAQIAAMSQREEIQPTDRQVIEHYGSTSDDPPPQSLTILLTRVGVACMDRLHEPKHLPMVRSDLTRLVTELRRLTRSSMADALDRLMQLWDGHSAIQKTGTADERREFLRAASSEFAKIQGAAQGELNAEERGAAAQLLTALHRVNDKLAGALALLPPIVASALEGDEIVVDDSISGTAFAVRFSTLPGSMPVQLTRATATLVGDVIEFALRDLLDELPVVVSPEQSALLTFSLPEGFHLTESAAVRVEVWYAFGGEQYRVVCDPPLRLERQACPTLPQRSPYIHGRPLVPEEIEGHFFGRQGEQRQILESVADGQQRLLYVEGIRRTGKSSLLNSVRREIAVQSLPLIPVSLDVSSVPLDKTAGQVLYNLFMLIALEPEVAAAGVTTPDERLCQDNPEFAYLQFAAQLAERLPERRVLALLDDFQALIEAGYEADKKNLPLTRGLTALLNLLHKSRGPSARLLWIFAGHRAKSEFRDLLPGPLLWGTLHPLRIDFLGPEAVKEIVTAPLVGTEMLVPPETSARVHALTCGHPEVVQEMAETMLLAAKAEGRWILTPADADAAARDAQYNDDKFKDTWYPVRELSPNQQQLMAAFINSVRQPGGRIEPVRLFPDQQLTEARREAIKGLVARNILDTDGETIGIKAFVLDLWLRRALPRMIQGEVNGSVAIFIDVPNVTGGSREAVLTNLRTSRGDGGIAGRFRLETVLDVIERYARSLSPAPVAVRWAANYPPNSPAVQMCYNKDYSLARVPEDFHQKGNDDEVLKQRITMVEQQYASVNHFVLVTGDKDFRIASENLLVNGKYVHVVSRDESKAAVYESMAKQYPQRFSFRILEDLIEEDMAIR